MYRDAAETLKVPLISGAIAGVLLVAGGWLLASGTQIPGFATAITIVVGLGVTSASLYARAKTQLTSLLAAM